MRLRTATIGAALAAFALGCDGAKPAAGEVRFPDGSPLPHGQVVFESQTLRSGGACEIHPDGTFHITQPLPRGEYVVYVTDARKPVNPGAGVFGPDLVAEPFTRPDTSPLRATVGGPPISLTVDPAGR